MADFAKLCEISDVDDGEIAAFEVEGETVAVARVGDSYYAFDDTCTHAMCSLADGWIDGTAGDGVGATVSYGDPLTGGCCKTGDQSGSKSAAGSSVSCRTLPPSASMT